MARQLYPARRPMRQQPRYSYTQQPIPTNPMPMLGQIQSTLNTVQQVSALLSNPMVQAFMPMLLGGGGLPQLPAAGSGQQQ